MQNEITIAGLGEIEANQALCECLNGSMGDLRLPELMERSEFCVTSGVYCDYYIHENTNSCDKVQPLFTRDDSMVHRVLNAMSDRQLDKVARYLRLEFGGGVGGNIEVIDMVSCLRATPNQKCAGALIALGLGKTP